MDMTLDSSNSRYLIRSYEPGSLRVNEEIYTQSVIVTPEHLIHPWAPQNFHSLLVEHLAELMVSSPQIILIGTGAKWQKISPEWLMIFYQQQIGVEIMDTRAACRTFNVLAAEGRKVAAGLLIV
jgi:uncharacterized protein